MLRDMQAYCKHRVHTVYKFFMRITHLANLIWGPEILYKYRKLFNHVKLQSEKYLIL